MKQKSTNKTKSRVQEPEKLSVLKRMKEALQNEKVPFIAGAVIIVLAIFVIISYISFLTTGGIDQSALESVVTESADYANSSGKLGANIAQMLINKWFGFAGIAIPLFMAIAGIKLLKIADFKLVKWFIIGVVMKSI